MVSSGYLYGAALHKRCCRSGDESHLLCRGCTRANAARGWQPALPHSPCPTEALLVGQLPELLMLQLRSGCSQRRDAPAAVLGIVPPGLCSVGASGSEPQGGGDAAGTTLLPPKCFPSSNRCCCPFRKISIRDLKAEAGKLRPGEAGSRCLSSCALHQWARLSFLLPREPAQHHKCQSGEQTVPGSHRASSIPAMGRGQGQHRSRFIPKHSPAWAGFGVTCLPHHDTQHLCSRSASALLGLGGPGLPPRHPPRLLAVPTRC